MSSNLELRRHFFGVLKRLLQQKMPADFWEVMRSNWSFEQIAVSGEMFLAEAAATTGRTLRMPPGLTPQESSNVAGWAMAELAHGDRGRYEGLLAQEAAASEGEPTP